MEFSQLFVDPSGEDLTKMAEEHGQGCPEVFIWEFGAPRKMLDSI
jgi:hypothetical protein